MSAEFGVDVSRETVHLLREFQILVEKWNPTVNLVSKADVPSLWVRHVVDSAQLFRHLPEGARTWCDFGSGGGFPGIVMAILAKEVAAGLHVTLIESDKRKSVFLRQAIQLFGLHATVLSERIDLAPVQSADVCSARALAPLRILCGFAARHLSATGTAIFPKGSSAADEVAEARRSWNFEFTVAPSRTDPEAQVLILKDISHA